MNDGLCPALCSVSYASVDDAVRCTLTLGRCVIGEFDIASAYRIVPVNPEDRLLLGLKWRGAAGGWGPAVWPQIGTEAVHGCCHALLWVMGRHGVVHAMHYLDDYLILGPQLRSLR